METEELLTEATELLERTDELLLPETEELLTEATELLEGADELLTSPPLSADEEESSER
jgi:hypothetical protein